MKIIINFIAGFLLASIAIFFYIIFLQTFFNKRIIGDGRCDYKTECQKSNCVLENIKYNLDCLL